MYSFRRGQGDDLEILLSLNQSERPHLGSVDASKLRWFIEEACHFEVVANQHGSPVGFLIALTAGKEYASPNYQFFCDFFKERGLEFVYVDRLALSESVRGIGLGRKLYRRLALRYEKSFGPEGNIACEVNLKPPNPDSSAFHERLGFSSVGTQETEGGEKRVDLLKIAIGSLIS